MDTGTIIVSRVYSKKSKASANTEEISDGFEVGAINHPIRGETISGDGWCVHETEEGLHIILVDGLGHGPQANHAAIKALSIFAENYKSSVNELLQMIHENIRVTRGAAVFLLASNQNQITYAGVGNISAVLRFPTKSKVLSSQNGTAGLRIGSIKALNEEWTLGDYIILHSDGLTARWNLDQYPGLLGKHSALIAGLLFRDFSRGSDDSSVVVVRRLK